MHTYVFLVDPLEIEVEDVPTVKCSTECPYAHGEQFKTSSGEVSSQKYWFSWHVPNRPQTFRLSCSKRHGTKPMYRDRQPTIKACMEACGRLTQCDSVDYDKNRQICYYSNHKAEPSVEAKSFVSAYSLGCGGACGESELSGASQCCGNVSQTICHDGCKPQHQRNTYN